MYVASCSSISFCSCAYLWRTLLNITRRPESLVLFLEACTEFICIYFHDLLSLFSGVYLFGALHQTYLEDLSFSYLNVLEFPLCLLVFFLKLALQFCVFSFLLFFVFLQFCISMEHFIKHHSQAFIVFLHLVELALYLLM